MRKITKVVSILRVIKENPNMTPKEIAKATEQPIGLVKHVIENHKEKQ